MIFLAKKKISRKKIVKKTNTRKVMAKSVCRVSKCSPRALGLSFGILWGLAVFFMGLGATYFSYGLNFDNMMFAMYPGFQLGLVGSIIGGLWGLVDGFIGGVIIGWLYNRFV